MGGALSDGGNLVAWLRKTIKLPDPKEAERAVSQMKPDSHGLTFLPLLAGERGPGWADHTHGIITGLSMATQPSQILRAALEAVALRFALIAEILDSVLPGERQVIATGGGLLGSRTWTLLALEAMEQIEALESIGAPLGETFEPNFERHEVYRSALARQRKLYNAAVENYFDQ
jgi:gluconokinase